MRLDLDRVAGRDTIGDPFGEPWGKRPPRLVNRFGIRIEREHARRVGSDTDCEAAVSAAELEDVLATKVREAVKRSEMRAFRIEDALHHPADSSAWPAGWQVSTCSTYAPVSIGLLIGSWLHSNQPPS